MKKILGLFLVFCLLFGMVSGLSALGAGAGTSVFLTASTVRGRIGGSANISVTISPEALVAAGSFELEYDNVNLVPVSYTAGASAQNSNLLANLNYIHPVTQAKKIKVSWMGTEPMGSGEIINIKFNVLSTALKDTTLPIILSNPILANAESYPISCTTTDGSITTYAMLFGDVNDDGFINIIDAHQILRHDAGLLNLSDGQLEAADFNRDATIDIFDAMTIQKFDLGLEEPPAPPNKNYGYLNKLGQDGMGLSQIRYLSATGVDTTSKLSENNLRINGTQKQNLYSPYTCGEFKSMFANTAIATNLQIGDAEPVLLSHVMKDCGGYNQTDALTPLILIHALSGAELLSKTAPIINDTFNYSLAEHPLANKLFTYSQNSNGDISEINIAVKTYDDAVPLNYAGSAQFVEYQASLNRFRGSRTLAPDAKIFYAPDNAPISEYSVLSVSQLQDGLIYNPYFFDMDVEGVHAVLLFELPRSMPANQSISVYSKCTTGRFGDEVVSHIYYWQNGASVGTPLIMDADTVIKGVKLSADLLSTGDVFLYSLRPSGRVDKIHVLFSPGTEQAKIPTEPSFTNYQFKSKMNVEWLQPQWKLIDDAYSDADSEIWFGYVYRKAFPNGTTQVTVVDPFGSYGNAELFSIPNTAKVIVYNPTLSDLQKLKQGSVGDIQTSYFPKVNNATNGDIAFDSTSFDKDDMEYIFLRLYQGIVTEVLVVDYCNN